MKTKFKMLLTTQNAKTSKGEDLGYLTGILYLIPSDKSNLVNVCKFASKGCKQSCLESAGRGKFNSVKKARLAKTELFATNLEYFMQSLVYSIHKVIRQAKRKNLTPCIRLNGTSDIPYETIRNSKGQNIFEMFPDVQFYDYTPDFTRTDAFLGKWKNYHLTFSRKESRANHVQAERLLSMGVNVAAVYLDVEKVIQTNAKAVNGDFHDLRFLNPNNGSIIALKAKGDAKKDLSGFVIRN
jgi:hypothetical protein